MGKDRHLEDDFMDPELEYTEGSEIAAAIDVSTYGSDKVFRPVYINQEDQILQLTPDDALRLLKFLERAVKFVEDYRTRRTQ